MSPYHSIRAAAKPDETLAKVRSFVQRLEAKKRVFGESWIYSWSVGFEKANRLP
jgi:hypothetical protein